MDGGTLHLLNNEQINNIRDPVIARRVYSCFTKQDYSLLTSDVSISIIDSTQYIHSFQYLINLKQLRACIFDVKLRRERQSLPNNELSLEMKQATVNE